MLGGVDMLAAVGMLVVVVVVVVGMPVVVDMGFVADMGFGMGFVDTGFDTDSVDMGTVVVVVVDTPGVVVADVERAPGEDVPAHAHSGQ